MGARTRCALAIVALTAWSPTGSAAAAADLRDLLEEQLVAHASAVEVAMLDDLKWDVDLRATVDDPLAVVRFWRDPTSGRFVADVLEASGRTIRIAGAARSSVIVPVPARPLAPGTILADGDLVDRAVPTSRLPSFATTDRSTLVGQQVRRALPEGHVIPGHSVMPPLAVARGDRVEISLRDGALSLVAPGRSLGDASAGEAVRVVNLATNASVSGVATGRGRVEVTR